MVCLVVVASLAETEVVRDRRQRRHSVHSNDNGETCHTHNAARDDRAEDWSCPKTKTKRASESPTTTHVRLPGVRHQ